MWYVRVATRDGLIFKKPFSCIVFHRYNDEYEGIELYWTSFPPNKSCQERSEPMFCPLFFPSSMSPLELTSVRNLVHVTVAQSDDFNVIGAICKMNGKCYATLGTSPVFGPVQNTLRFQCDNVAVDYLVLQLNMEGWYFCVVNAVHSIHFIYYSTCATTQGRTDVTATMGAFWSTQEEVDVQDVRIKTSSSSSKLEYGGQGTFRVEDYISVVKHRLQLPQCCLVDYETHILRIQHALVILLLIVKFEFGRAHLYKWRSLVVEIDVASGATRIVLCAKCRDAPVHQAALSNSLVRDMERMFSVPRKQGLSNSSLSDCGVSKNVIEHPMLPYRIVK